METQATDAVTPGDAAVERPAEIRLVHRGQNIVQVVVLALRHDRRESTAGFQRFVPAVHQHLVDNGPKTRHQFLDQFPVLLGLAANRMFRPFRGKLTRRREFRSLHVTGQHHFRVAEKGRPRTADAALHERVVLEVHESVRRTTGGLHLDRRRLGRFRHVPEEV